MLNGYRIIMSKKPVLSLVARLVYRQKLTIIVNAAAILCLLIVSSDWFIQFSIRQPKNRFH